MKKRLKGELIPPVDATKDPAARELIRAWVANGRIQMTLTIGEWADYPGHEETLMWGKILADVAHHVANAIEEDSGQDRRETLELVRDQFNDAIDHPLAKHRGKFLT